MKENEKKSLISLLGGIGTIVLLIGLFTPLYEFMYGLVAAIAIWIVTGVTATYLGLKGTETKASKKPKSQKDKIKDFKGHLIVYVVIIGMLLVINLLSYEGEFWVVWPAVIWGAFVLIQGLTTYLL